MILHGIHYCVLDITYITVSNSQLIWTFYFLAILGIWYDCSTFFVHYKMQVKVTLNT